jgi:hypothetical protein
MKTFWHICAVLVMVPVVLALAVWDVVVNG